MNSQIEPQDSALHCWERIDSSNSKAIISVIHPANSMQTLPDADEIYVLNATQNDNLFINENKLMQNMEAISYSYLHKETGRYVLNPQDYRLTVPAAGFTVLTKKK